MSEAYLKFLKALLALDSNQLRYDTLNKIPYDRYEKSPEEIEADFINVVEQELRAKIQSLNSERSALKQKMTKAQILEWLKKYVPFAKDAEDLINVYSMAEQKIETYTIADLRRLAKNKVNKYVVKGLMPTGSLFLLASPPKVGKSLIATSLGLAVARGIPFLNRETVKGNVLYIQNEEQLETTTVNRIYNHGLQNLELESPELYNKLAESESLLIVRGLDIVLDQEKILELVKEHNISLVIIDSLGASIRRSGYSELNPELGTYLYGLQNKCQVNDFTCVILHHSTKADSNEDKTKMTFGIAGSNVIPRANDGMFRLFSVKNTQGEEVISFRSIPREGEPVNMTLKMEKDEACYWYFSVDKESSLSPEMIELQNEILILLYERHELWKASLESEDDPTPVYGYTLKELMEITNQTKTILVSRLNDMTTTEAIIRYPFEHSSNGRAFVYAIHPSGESWMKVYLERDKEKKKEEQEKEILRIEYIAGIKDVAKDLLLKVELNNKTEALSLWNDLTIQERIDVNKELNKEQKNQFLLLIYPPMYNIGDKVTLVDSNEEKTITRIEYCTKSEKGYHNYYVDDNKKPYLQEAIKQ